MKKVGVLGSISTDFVAATNVLPKESETIVGKSFSTQFGGKGANKAVALSRLGKQVVMFGAVGDDEFSRRALANLKEERVDVKHVKKLRGEIGGIATIFSSQKTNMIVMVPGANNAVDEEYLQKIENEIKKCDCIVAELEVPQQAVLFVSQICKKNNIKFILNPSPIMKFDKTLLDNADLIVVNETEIKHLPNFKSQKQALIDYAGRLVLTVGKRGAYVYEDGEIVHLPAVDTPVVDTTGAGDAFLGGLIDALLEGAKLKNAVEFANVCAGLKVSKLGAQTGMPTIKEVKTFLQR